MLTLRPYDVATRRFPDADPRVRRRDRPMNLMLLVAQLVQWISIVILGVYLFYVGHL